MPSLETYPFTRWQWHSITLPDGEKGIDVLVSRQNPNEWEIWYWDGNQSFVVAASHNGGKTFVTWHGFRTDWDLIRTVVEKRIRWTKLY